MDKQDVLTGWEEGRLCDWVVLLLLACHAGAQTHAALGRRSASALSEAKTMKELGMAA